MSDGTVSAVLADGTGATPAPVLSVETVLDGLNPMAGTAAMPEQSVDGETVMSGLDPMAGIAAMPAPAVSDGGSGSATVTAVAATATGAMPEATITADQIVGGSEIVSAVTAAMPAPAVAGTSSGSVAVTAVAATSTAAFRAPTLTASTVLSGLAPMGATAAMFAQSASGTSAGAATVTAVAATSTAALRAPTVSVTGSVAVTAIAATATGVAPVPILTGGGTGYLLDHAGDATLPKVRLYYLGLATPVYWTDLPDHDIEWNGHTWTAQPITPGSITIQPETETASFAIGDADDVLFPVLVAQNGGELVFAAIYEVAFAPTNLSATPDDVMEIFSGRLDYASCDTAGTDTITITLMPPAQTTALYLPTRLLSRILT